MSATQTLARFIAGTDYDSLPPPVVEAAKIAILDGVANMAAGSVQELADIIGRYVRDSGGTPQASVVGWGYKTNLRGRPSPTGSSAIAWTTRFKGSRPLTALRPACRLLWPWVSSIKPPAKQSSPPTLSDGKSRAAAGCIGPRHRPGVPSAGSGRPLWVARRRRPGPLGWTASRP